MFDLEVEPLGPLILSRSQIWIGRGFPRGWYSRGFEPESLKLARLAGESPKGGRSGPDVVVVGGISRAMSHRAISVP